MNNRLSTLLLAIAMSGTTLGCSQSNSANLSTSAADAPNNHAQQRHSAALTWSPYSDPTADANLAIAQQDFRLLAFAGRATSFPGIDGNITAFQQKCGYRLLANTSDALRSKSELNLRKQIYQYAATFNQIVLEACHKNH